MECHSSHRPAGLLAFHIVREPSISLCQAPPKNQSDLAGQGSRAMWYPGGVLLAFLIGIFIWAAKVCLHDLRAS
jgi:hypothetical protein